MGFIIGIIVLLAAAGVLASLARKARDGLWYGVGAVVCVVAAVVAVLFGAVTTVQPSDTGIVTAFGNVQGRDLGPGLHLLPPWDTVTTWDDSVQQTTFDGKNCLILRIANQQTACTPVTVFWRDDRGNADSQFRLYRTFAQVTTVFMSRIVVGKFFNNVFERFDPVTEASSTAKPGSPADPTISQLGREVQAEMRAADAGQITIESLDVGQPAYDPQVQTALNKETTAAANTNVAAQNVQTAIQQRLADKDLQQNLTPLVVAQNCLNITQTLSQDGDKLNVAWNCLGGTTSILAGGK